MAAKNNVKKLRGKHGVSQRKLAKKCGITYQGISIAENGRLSADLAVKVANALDENVFSVLGAQAFVIQPKTAEDVQVLQDYLASIEF